MGSLGGDEKPFNKKSGFKVGSEACEEDNQ